MLIVGLEERFEELGISFSVETSCLFVIRAVSGTTIMHLTHRRSDEKYQALLALCHRRDILLFTNQRGIGSH